MKIQLFRILIMIFSASFMFSACENSEQVSQHLTEGTSITRTIVSEALSGSLLDENINQDIRIYLPPSYYDSDSSYPVIYYLHGWGASYDEPYYFQKTVVDQAIVKDGAGEFIVVEPNGRSILGGSFYWNSPVSGNWEDFIVNELIDYMDSNFRTIASKEGRGLAGYSMGGTGAVNIGFKHSDKYYAIYAMAPGLLQDGDLDTLLLTWEIDGAFSLSYGAAASPNDSLAWPYSEIPYDTFTDGTENQRVIDNWYSLFGDQENKVLAYLEIGIPLSGIKIQANSDDYYSWIPNGTRDLHRILTENEIDHDFENPEDGGHNLPVNFVTNDLFPFFSEHLDPAE